MNSINRWFAWAINSMPSTEPTASVEKSAESSRSGIPVCRHNASTNTREPSSTNLTKVAKSSRMSKPANSSVEPPGCQASQAKKNADPAASSATGAR